MVAVVGSFRRSLVAFSVIAELTPLRFVSPPMLLLSLALAIKLAHVLVLFIFMSDA